MRWLSLDHFYLLLSLKETPIISGTAVSERGIGTAVSENGIGTVVSEHGIGTVVSEHGIGTIKIFIIHCMTSEQSVTTASPLE